MNPKKNKLLLGWRQSSRYISFTEKHIVRIGNFLSGDTGESGG